MVAVIGAGLAGCEAALAVADAGIKVDLFEQKPHTHSPAHSYDGFCELVCSNSLKAMRKGSAAGLLKIEMELLGSSILKAAYQCDVPAGGALAVDREKFSDIVTKMIGDHPLINVIEQQLEDIPQGYDITIVASGPLTSGGLAQSIKKLTGEGLSFYDAAAPIIKTTSIDMDSAFYAARYGRGGADYINCPLTYEEYTEFYSEIISAQRVELHGFEKNGSPVYEGCMPIEVMASRGEDTMRYGPMRPVGIYDPVTDKRPYAILQLRAENAEKTMYNMVGFQTNLKFPEQKRVFSIIPALKNAEYVRFGVMHRNSFINSPILLDQVLRLKSRDDIIFAGQITGVEGYTESAMCGLVAGINAARIVKRQKPLVLPRGTMSGELLHHVTHSGSKDFQPMGSNMGLLPPLEERIKDKRLRYEAVADRAIDKLKKYLEV